jgi:dihydrofolate synthase/folylpolyglutamate synthase
MTSLASWLAQQERSHPNAIDLGLSRVREVARRMDLLRPKHPVITVGGTNGKGSTVAFLDAVLRATGHRCGRFTSPHLTRYNERICIDGVEASDAALIESFERIDQARREITLTFFEYNTLAALHCFARSSVDVAVLEVGLGGRLDATNIIDADVAVVCSIGLDHVDWLGSSIEDIGREKAGIFRPGRPAVLGSAEMPRSVFEVAQSLESRMVVPGRDYFAVPEQQDAADSPWRFECGRVRLHGLPPPALAGRHQRGNAATALAALASGGFTLSVDAVARALRAASIRGRFQVLPGIPPDDVEWVLDVAHNVPAAEGLRDNLAVLPARRTVAVCGVLGDKDIAGIVGTLAPSVDAWVLAGLAGPRAVSTQALSAALPSGSRIVAHADSVAQACDLARTAAAPGGRVVVFGSFLTVGPALDFRGI